MNVTREVVLDLLPVYLSGEASPGTCALVEEFAKDDAEVAESIRIQRAESFLAPSTLAPDQELRSLRRARSVLGWQRWLFGMAIFFTSLLLSNSFSIEGGRVKGFHLLLSNYPVALAACVVLGAACWVGYFSIRRGVRTTR